MVNHPPVGISWDELFRTFESPGSLGRDEIDLMVDVLSIRVEIRSIMEGPAMIAIGRGGICILAADHTYVTKVIQGVPAGKDHGEHTPLGRRLNTLGVAPTARTNATLVTSNPLGIRGDISKRTGTVARLLEEVISDFHRFNLIRGREDGVLLKGRHSRWVNKNGTHGGRKGCRGGLHWLLRGTMTTSLRKRLRFYVLGLHGRLAILAHCRDIGRCVANLNIELFNRSIVRGIEQLTATAVFAGYVLATTRDITREGGTHTFWGLGAGQKDARITRGRCGLSQIGRGGWHGRVDGTLVEGNRT